MPTRVVQLIRTPVWLFLYLSDHLLKLILIRLNVMLYKNNMLDDGDKYECYVLYHFSSVSGYQTYFRLLFSAHCQILPILYGLNFISHSSSLPDLTIFFVGFYLTLILPSYIGSNMPPLFCSFLFPCMIGSLVPGMWKWNTFIKDIILSTYSGKK